MKIFIIGLPQSGRTKVAKEIACAFDSPCISAFDWIQSTFREKRKTELEEDYRKELFSFVSERLKINQYLLVDNVFDLLEVNKEKEICIIDGINSPKDFIHLFDYNKDIVLFLNRTNGPSYVEGFDQICVNVIRDYCLWLASRELLPKEFWYEFNFAIPGDPKDNFVKLLGSKNTVTLVKSIEKVIELIKEKPWKSK